MKNNEKEDRSFNVVNKLTILISFFVLMAFISLKAKYDNLASDYLQAAPKVGKYYAFACAQHEKECLLLLQKNRQDSLTRIYWIDKIFRDQLLQQQYHQVVLDYFEKEIVLIKNRIKQGEPRCNICTQDAINAGGDSK